MNAAPINRKAFAEVKRIELNTNGMIEYFNRELQRAPMQNTFNSKSISKSNREFINNF
jgi:hypothetical protein